MADGLALDRRALMRSAILLVGGVVAGVPDLAFASTSSSAFFTPAESAVLKAYCGALIPKTDTPGAIEVGVPAFIDAMMTNWAAPETSAELRSVLTRLDEQARTETGKSFAALSGSERDVRLRAFDAAQLGARDPGYRRLKELTMTGYYLSEIGATQELRYELSPGVWEPSIKLGPDTRAWAA